MVPTSNYVAGMAKAGWLQPLDKSQGAQPQEHHAAYLNTEFDPGNKYSVPYAYVDHDDRLQRAEDEGARHHGRLLGGRSSIPKILEKIKGRVTVLDSQSELMAAALKYLGYSVNDRDPKHWQEAKDVILKAKPYWAAFKASGYIKELAAGNIWVVHGYSNDIFQADLGRAGSEAEVPHPAQPAQGRRGAGAGRDGHRARARRVPIWRISSSTSCSTGRTPPTSPT